MVYQQRIDVHQHMAPPFWVEAAAGVDARVLSFAPWSDGEALRAMDAVGTSCGLLSVTTPGVNLGGPEAARVLARRVNDFGADMVRRRPDRFGLFAAVPTLDIEAAVDEAVYALDDLNADGVGLMSNGGGRYLGDPLFRPLWQALEDRGAVVLIHPAPVVGLPELPGTAGWADFLFDTTRTAIHMVINQVMRDFRSVKIILAHAGGFLPYGAGRFEALTSFDPALSREQVHRDLRSFYFETALSSTPATLSGLLEFAGPDRVLYGTDWPAAPLEGVVDTFAASLDAFLDKHPSWADPINFATARSLFKRDFSQAAE